MQIDWSILISLGGLAATILTIVRTSAKTQEHTNSKIEVVQNDIKHLSERVERHNGVIERTYALEQAQAVLKEEVKVEQNRMKDVESELKEMREKK